MSDDDYDYDYDDGGYSDNDDYDNQSDERPQEEIEMENDFYQADDEKNNQPEQALELFLKVIKTEEDYRQDTLPESQEFIFNSLKNVIVLLCRLQKSEQLLEQVEKILKYVGSVARNDATEAISEFTENLVKLEDKEVMKNVLEIILKYLKENSMEQLLCKALFKLAYIYFDSKEIDRVRQTLDDIFKICRKSDGTDDEKKASILLEGYALEIQLCVIKNLPIKKILKKVQYIREMEKNSITDNRIMGIIQENTGKMFMKQRKYNDAHQEFLEAFKAYQEVGNSRAKRVLKYWCVASILSHQQMDPFAEQSTQVYSQDQEIQAMQQLRLAFQNDQNPNIKKFKNIIDKKENHISDDEFLSEYTEELKKTMSLKKIKSLIQGYEKIKLKYLGFQLLCNEQQVEKYLMELILSDQIQGFIDATTGIFENEAVVRNPAQQKKLDTINKWAASITAY